MTTLASWRLENDIVVGLLEHLLASRSLASAILSLLRLRIFSLWTLVILLTWCLSPLGGQAALRVVSSTVSRTTHPAWLSHVDWNGSVPVNTYASDEMSFGYAIKSAFVAALSGNNDTKQGPQDTFGNLRIPMLEALIGQPDKDGWHDTSTLESPTHASLVGIPFSGPERNERSTFTMQTAYFFLDCNVDINKWIARNETSAYNAHALPGSAYEPSAKMYNNTRFPTSNVTRVSPILRDLTANHQCNDSIARIIGFQSRTYGDERGMVTEAWCTFDNHLCRRTTFLLRWPPELFRSRYTKDPRSSFPKNCYRLGQHRLLRHPISGLRRQNMWRGSFTTRCRELFQTIHGRSGAKQGCRVYATRAILSRTSSSLLSAK